MQHKKTVIFVIIGVVAALAVGGFFALQYAKSRSYTKLWPESGVAIATIEGKTLYYDPLYCFKVSNGYSPDDPAEIIEGTTMTGSENLLLGELVYMDSDKKVGDMDEKVNAILAERKAYADTNQYCQTMKTKIMEQENLSEAEYWQMLVPYMEKYVIITEYANAVADKLSAENPNWETEDAVKAYREDLQKLTEKYNIEILQ